MPSFLGLTWEAMLQIFPMTATAPVSLLVAKCLILTATTLLSMVKAAGMALASYVYLSMAGHVASLFVLSASGSSPTSPIKLICADSHTHNVFGIARLLRETNPSFGFCQIGFGGRLSFLDGRRISVLVGN